MSRYHKTKCSQEEAKNFKHEVVKFMRENGYEMKTRALRCYDGCVKVYSGSTIERFRLRRGLRFISDNADGTKTYERHNDPIIEKNICSVFCAEWDSKEYGEEERYYLLNWLKKLSPLKNENAN